MSFVRTSQGLTNLRLFYKKDKVVFVEGGQTELSFQLVLSGKYDGTAIDIKYWNGLFKYFKRNKKYEFRAVGSKTTLKAIVDKIRNENVKNIYIAMDRDYDNHFGRIANLPEVIYTYGYAWENDVWSQSVTEHLLSTLVTSQLQKEHLRSLRHLRRTFLRSLTRALRLHITLRYFDQSLFPRDNFGGLYDPSTLILQKSRLRHFLNQAKLNRNSGVSYFAPKNWKVSNERDCPCHLLGFYSSHLIRYVYKASQNSNLSISNDVLASLAVSSFLSAIKSHLTKRAYEYYERQFEQLPA